MSRKIVIGLTSMLAVILTALGGALAFGGGATSANFSATDDVVFSAEAGVLDIQSVNPISFSKLVPGQPQVQTMKFTNPGNVRGDQLLVGLPVTVNNWQVPAGQNPDWSQVLVSIQGYLAPTPVTSLPSRVNIGAINAGGEREVKVTLVIKSAGDNDAGDAKDNQFQNVKVAGKGTAKVRTS